MRALAITLVALVPLSTGCKLFKLAGYNSVSEPIAYADDECVRKRAIKLAKEAWLDHVSVLDGACPSAGYERGYIDGFADYLVNGGNGAPPTIPPLKLRTKKYLNPNGHDEIDEYYGGFVAGAGDARASGLREYFTIPISTPLPTNTSNDYKPPTPRTDREPDPLEVLPPPKPINPDEPEMTFRDAHRKQLLPATTSRPVVASQPVSPRHLPIVAVPVLPNIESKPPDVPDNPAAKDLSKPVPQPNELHFLLEFELGGDRMPDMPVMRRPPAEAPGPRFPCDVGSHKLDGPGSR